jgi:hypothetical protein
VWVTGLLGLQSEAPNTTPRPAPAGRGRRVFEAGEGSFSFFSSRFTSNLTKSATSKLALRACVLGRLTFIA